MLTASPAIALTHAILFTGEAFVEGHALLIDGGRVVDIVLNDRIPDGFLPHSCEGSILAPAYIDCQVNGGDNILFNADPSPKALIQIAAAHRKTGTTRLLPTVITDTPAITRAAIEAMRAAKEQDSSILGLHIEGPHISVEKKGMHEAALIRAITETDLALYKKDGDELFLITVAPETVPPEMIAALKANGVIVSLGHSVASADATQKALKAGARGFTHVFNGMPPLYGRDGGIAAIALADRESYCGIILDGAHVSREMAQLACAAKDEDKLFMVSDSIAPSGAVAPQPYTYCNEAFNPKDGVCRDEKGMLAGALLTLGECVPVAIRDLRLDPARVLRMASTIPAAFLGVEDRLGKLLPSYMADVVALDLSFKPVNVWKDGIRVA